MVNTGAFTRMEPFVWDPDRGGFAERAFVLPFYSSKIVDPRARRHFREYVAGNEYPSGIHSIEVKIATTQVKDNPFVISSNRSDFIGYLKPGDTFGIVSPSRTVTKRRVTSNADPYHFEASLLYSIPAYLDDFILWNYDRLRGKSFEITALFAASTYYGDIESQGQLSIGIREPKTQAGKRLVKFQGFSQLGSSSFAQNSSISHVPDVFSNSISGFVPKEERAKQSTGGRNHFPFGGIDLSNPPSTQNYTLKLGAINWDEDDDSRKYINEIAYTLGVNNNSPLVARVEYSSGSANQPEVGIGDYKYPVEITPTPYLLSRALQRANLNQSTEQIFNYDISSFVSTGGTKSKRAAGYRSGMHTKVKIPKNVSSRVNSVNVHELDYSKSHETITLTISGVGLTPSSNMQIEPYLWKGPGQTVFRDLFGKSITKPNVMRRILPGGTSYEITFTFTEEFKAAVARLYSYGVLYLNISWTDFGSGKTVYYADESLRLRLKSARDGVGAIVEDMRLTSLSAPIELRGFGFQSYRNALNFDELILDVMYESRVIGGMQSEEYVFSTGELDYTSGEDIVFQIEPSLELANYLFSGRKVSLRASLWKNNKELPGASAYSSYAGDVSGSRGNIEGLKMRSGVVQHSGQIQFLAKSGLGDIEHIHALLIRPQRIPSDPLALSVQNLDSPSYTHVLGYVTPHSSVVDRDGYMRVNGTVTLLSGKTQGLRNVDLLVLRNVAKNSTGRGKYTSYAALNNLVLSSSTTGESRSQNGARNPWTGTYKADFYTNYTGTHSDMVANPSQVWTSTAYRTTGSQSTALIGTAFPDPNMLDYDRELAGWRLVDKEWIRARTRRWHGLADVLVETPYPLTENITTQSVFIGREPCIESVMGVPAQQPVTVPTPASMMITVSGYGFSANTKLQSANDYTRWVSCVNGATFYNDSHVSISDLPFATSVIRYPNGKEEFALNVRGACSSSTVSGYAVISTDYGTEWVRLDLSPRTSTVSMTSAWWDPDFDGISNRGGRVKIYTPHFQQHNGSYASAINIQNTSSTVTQNLTTHSVARLEYNDSLSISEIVYTLLGWKSGTWPANEHWLNFSDISLTLSFQPNALVTVLDTQAPGMLCVHPGTGASSNVKMELSGYGMVAAGTLSAKSGNAISGGTFTVDSVRPTHRSLQYTIAGTYVTASTLYRSWEDAFEGSTTYSSTTAGGISTIQVVNTNGTSGVSRYYGIADSASHVALLTPTIPWDTVGGQGTRNWNLGSGTIDGGYGIPGATKVPWGLFSSTQPAGLGNPRRRAFVHANQLGYPRISIRPEGNSAVRMDAYTDTVVRGPWIDTVSVTRNVIDGNAVSPSWIDSAGSTDSRGIESFTPLTFTCNHGSGPNIQGTSGAWLGNDITVRASYIHGSASLQSLNARVSNVHYANQFKPDLYAASVAASTGHTDTEGNYQKDLYASEKVIDYQFTASLDPKWSAWTFHDYNYRGWVYTASRDTVSSPRLVAELYPSTSASQNACDFKIFPFDAYVYEPIVQGSHYMVITQNTLRSKAVTVSSMASSSVGQGKLAFTFVSGLRSEKIDINSATGMMRFPYVEGNTPVKSIEIVSPERNIKISTENATVIDDGAMSPGDKTVKVRPVSGAEFGFREPFYRVAGRGVGVQKPRSVSDFFYTRAGKKSDIRIAPTLHIAKPDISDSVENYLLGIPPVSGAPILVSVIRVSDGKTAPITDILYNSRRVAFTPTKMASLGLQAGDVVRVGLQTDAGEVLISEREYAIGTLVSVSGNKGRALGVTITLPASSESVVRWPNDDDISALTYLSVEIPAALQSTLDKKLLFSVFLTNKIQTAQNGFYILTNPPAPFSELLVHGMRLNFVAKATGGSYFFSTDTPVVINDPSGGVGENSSFAADYLWPPKLAPSYIDGGVTASTFDALNPRALNSNTFYWSESVSYSSTASTEYIQWPLSMAYGAGVRIAGKHLVNKKEESPIPDDPYMGTPVAEVNYETDFFANLYTHTLSNTITSSTTYPGSPWNTISAEDFVSFVAADPYYAKHIYAKAASLLNDRWTNTEWQEISGRFNSGLFSQKPPEITYGGLLLHAKNRDSHDPDGDKIGVDDLDKVPITYIDLDRVDWSGGNIPTPSVDTSHPMHLEGSGTWSSTWSIVPHEIGRDVPSSILRISGANLVGNANSVYGGITPSALASVVVTLTNGVNVITASQGRIGTYSSYGNEYGNNSSQYYALFQSDTSSPWVEGVYDLSIETKWVASSSIQTLSTTCANAVVVKVKPQMELIDERMPVLPDRYNSYVTGSLSRPMAYATVAHCPAADSPVYTSSNDVVRVSAADFLFANSTLNPGFRTTGSYGCLTSSVYEVWKPTARDFGIYDKYLSVQEVGDPAITPVVLSKTNTAGLAWRGTNNYLKYRIPNLVDSSASIRGTYSTERNYSIALQNQRWNYGIETNTTLSGSLAYTGVSDLSLTNVADRGPWAYQENAVQFTHHHIPRVRNIIGASANNIVNYVDGKVIPGNGKPRVEIELSEQDAGHTDSASRYIVGIEIGFKTGSVFLPRGTSGPYGDVEVFRGGSSWYPGYTLVTWTPNRNAVDLIKKIRSGGWLDYAVVCEYPTQPQQLIRIKDFKTLRVDWTVWDTPATQGGTVINNPVYEDAVLYRLRMVKDSSGNLRAAWGTHYDRYLYEVTSQEALTNTGNDDWFIVVGSSDFNEHTGNGTVRLYGAREKDLIYDLRNADNPSYVGQDGFDTFVRDSRRGMQLLAEATVPGNPSGMAWMNDSIFVSSITVTSSDFKFHIGKSPHSHTDSIGATFSTTHGTLLGDNFVDSDISDVLVKPKHASSHEDAAELAIAPPRRKWNRIGNARFSGDNTHNIINNSDFETAWITYNSAYNGLAEWSTAAAISALVTISSINVYVSGHKTGSRLLVMEYNSDVSATAGQIAHNLYLDGKTPYALDLRYRTYDTTSAERYPCLSVSMTTDLSGVTQYYDFNTWEWSSTFVPKVLDYSKTWIDRRLYIQNNISSDHDVVGTLTMEIVPGFSTFAASTSYSCVVDYCRLSPLDEPVHGLYNGDFEYFDMSGGTAVASDWTTGSDTRLVTISSGTSVESLNVPTSGLAYIDLDSSSLNSAVTASVLKYAIQPGGSYTLRFNAFSTTSAYANLPVFVKLQHEQDAVWDGLTWSPDVSKWASTSIQTHKGLTQSDGTSKSLVSYTYDIPFTLQDTGGVEQTFALGDSYTVTFNTRTGSPSTVYAAHIGLEGVRIDQISRYTTGSTLSTEATSAFGHEHAHGAGKAGFYLGSNEYKYKHDWNVEGLFRYRGFYEYGTQSVISIGHGVQSAKGSGYNLLSLTGSTYAVRACGTFPTSATGYETFTSATLSPDRWYWVGMSHTNNQNLFAIFEYNHKPWVQAWETVSWITSSATYTVEFPSQPISIGTKRNDFFKIDNFSALNDRQVSGAGGQFIWDFGTKAEVINNKIMGGADTALSISDTSIYFEDVLFGKGAIDPRYADTLGADNRIVDNVSTVTNVGALGNNGTSYTESAMASSTCLHGHKAFTIASWSKIAYNQFAPGTTLNNRSCIFTHGTGDIIVDTTASVKSFSYLSGTSDAISKISLAGATDSSTVECGVATYSERQPSHPTYGAWYADTRFMIYSVDSTYQIGGVNANYFGIDFKALGANENGTYLTQSINEWWLNLTSFRISNSDNWEFYALRIPYSKLNDPSVYTMDGGDAYTSLSEFAVYCNLDDGDPNVDAGMATIAGLGVIDSDAIIFAKKNIGTHVAGNWTLPPVAVGTQGNGTNTYSGLISEVAYLPDVYVDHNNIADILIQAGPGGISPTETLPGIVEIAQVQVGGFALHTSSPESLIAGLPTKLAQRRSTLRVDQENPTPREVTKIHDFGSQIDSR